MQNHRRGRPVRAAAATFVAGITAVGLTATGSPALAAGSAAHAAHAKAAAQKSEAVIVVLRDQLAKTPARRSALSARTSAGRVSQSAVLHRLAGPKPQHLKQYGLVNAFAATRDRRPGRALAADPAVAA